MDAPVFSCQVLFQFRPHHHASAYAPGLHFCCIPEPCLSSSALPQLPQLPNHFCACTLPQFSRPCWPHVSAPCCLDLRTFPQLPQLPHPATTSALFTYTFPHHRLVHTGRPSMVTLPHFSFSCPKRTPSRVFSQLRLCFFLPSPVYPPWLSLSLPIYFTLHKGRSGISALPGIYTFPAPPGIPSSHILLFRLSHISM